MREFLQMGGYAAYVWSAYGITLIVMIYSIWSAYRRHATMLARATHAPRAEAPERQPTVKVIP